MRSLLGLMNQFLLITKILLLGIVSFNVLGVDKTNFSSHTIVWQGVEREYLIYLPEEYKDSKKEYFPLVVGLHGYVGTSSGFERETSKGLNLHAEKENYIAVYPQGSHFNNSEDDKSTFVSSWNDIISNAEPAPGQPLSCSHKTNPVPRPKECSTFGLCAWTSCYDDLGFIKQIIEVISQSYKVDIERRYMVGLSNGGAMTHKFACTYPDLLAAAVAVAPSIAKGRSCTPDSSLPYLQIFGENDKITPSDDSQSAGGYFYENPLNSFNSWSDSMQCNSQVIRDDLLIAKKEGLICYSRKQCEISTHEVVNCMIPEGGHHWPGQTPDAGYCRNDIQANTVSNYYNCKKDYPSKVNWGNDMIWEFLNKHRKVNG
jgi:poly(3-hydroxybutyrate) depolymerase